jgi:hypothetical protein
MVCCVLASSDGIPSIYGMVEVMSASTDLRDAQCDRIMEMTIEELAASEGMTVEELLEEGRQIKERMMEFIRRRFPEFGK